MRILLYCYSCNHLVDFEIKYGDIIPTKCKEKVINYYNIIGIPHPFGEITTCGGKMVPINDPNGLNENV